VVWGNYASLGRGGIVEIRLNRYYLDTVTRNYVEGHGPNVVEGWALDLHWDRNIQWDWGQEPTIAQEAWTGLIAVWRTGDTPRARTVFQERVLEELDRAGFLDPYWRNIGR
jgi:hypothetical protein